MVNPSILIIDDNPIFCGLLQDSLRRAGYITHTAHNGQAALKIFEQTSVDLVLLDVVMPGWDGHHLCRELRSRNDVPIILLSSLDSPEEILYGLSLGADDYVTKPFELRELELRIQATVQRVNRCTEQEPKSTSSGRL
jgi:DNA-binding response OmpR family regulator